MAIDIPQDIIQMLAREAACIKQYRHYNSPSDLIKAQSIRAEIDKRYWSTFEIVRFK